MIHESKRSKTNEWLTPPEIIRSLGEFDLDPCSPIKRPWDTAKKHFTILDNGLLLPWENRVWLNPPYSTELPKWLAKMAIHNNGVALTFARTETVAFQRYVFPVAMSILFIAGRLRFYTVTGEIVGSATAPAVLIGYGEENTDALAECGINGKHVLLNAFPMITIQTSPDWRSVVNISLIKLNGAARLSDIYEMVERIAPDKIKRNSHYQAKIRQKLQKYFTRIDKGYYTLFDN